MDHKAFDDKRIADGYAKDRPWLHPKVINIMKNELQIDKPFDCGLDVGCGAGLSTKALKKIASHVTGVDVSEHMIAQCKSLYPGADYDFLVSKAENINVGRKFDIVTAAGVINWVDESLFLTNLKHVLAEHAVIAIYDFWITDSMINNPAFTAWWRESFLTQFPKPYRKETKWTEETLTEGYRMEKQTDFSFRHPFTMDSLIRFLMIQSHVNSQIASGARSEESVREWMEQSLSPVFGDAPEEKEFVFDGYCWYIRSEDIVSHRKFSTKSS